MTTTAVRLATRIPTAPVAFGIPARFGSRAPSVARQAEAGGSAAPGVTMTLPKGGFVFEQGDASEGYYKVLSGAVRLCRLLPDGRRHVADFVVGGEIFGFEHRTVQGYTAEAITDATVARFPTGSLEFAMAGDPALGRTLLATACSALAAAHEQLLVLGRMSAAERVAVFLLRMARRTGHQDEARPTIHLFMSRADIADHLGLTPETVCRTLTAFRREGLVALEAPSRIVLLQPAALRELTAVATTF